MSPPIRRLSRSAGLALAAGLFAFGTAARAQSLAELYEAARGYDTIYLGARALADSVTYRVEQTYALKRPSVGLGLSSTYNDGRVRPQSPSVFNPNSSFHYLSNQAAINAKYPLFNRGNRLTIEQAGKALDVAQADVDAAEQDLVIRLAQAYFDVLAAQDTLALTRSNKTLITEQLASAKRNFEVGTATITDTREAQARFDLATAQEIAAENDLRTKRAALDQLVGRAGVAPKPIAAPLVLPALVPADVEAWVATAEQLHPNVRRALANVDIAAYDTARAKVAWEPVVDLVGSAGVEQTNRSNFGAQPNGRSTLASIGVQLNMPIYSGGAIDNRVKEALLLEEKARDDLESARRGVALGTRQLFLGVESGRAQVLALEAAESSSKLALEATQLGYKVGVRVNVDVLNAQTQLFQTQRDLARARYDLLLAKLRLRQASGQLDATDVASLNALLAP